MAPWLIATILGFVEGLTEFLPVSSTGHLLITEHYLKLDETSFFTSDLFNIVVQCGAVLAVLPLFTDRLRMLAAWREPESRLFLAKIAAAFLITAAGGLILDKLNYKLTENVANVAWALIIGGVLFVAAEKWLAARQQRPLVTWPSTTATAFGQLLAAVFPGSSRSGSTIILALLCGTNRVAATEFSFLVGIPTILAAGLWKIRKALKHADPAAAPPEWGMLLLASIVAAVVSFIAVKWLLRFVQSHTFIGFGIYRIAFGIYLLLALHRELRG
jgi:undecaprenyl-diphosphatase